MFDWFRLTPPLGKYLHTSLRFFKYQGFVCETFDLPIRKMISYTKQMKLWIFKTDNKEINDNVSRQRRCSVSEKNNEVSEVFYGLYLNYIIGENHINGKILLIRLELLVSIAMWQILTFLCCRIIHLKFI